MSHTNDTIVAHATPQGEGAIGVIRLSGPQSITIADEIFYGKKLKEVVSHTVHFGTIRHNLDDIIDEVLLSVFINPSSYTGEDVIEISCHGSSYVLKEILQLCITKGARMAEPGEFTMRAFLNGKLDLSQAEAVADLIASDSKVSHDIAMKQMRGGFSKDIQQLRQELIHFTSMIELELDFGEEDVEFADRAEFKKLLIKIYTLVTDLKQSFELGNVLKNGVPTVIAGKPNAGKSTLLNALLNEERAIVSDIAGTTRDTIEEALIIDGVQFRLIDTAGIRETSDQIEHIGVQKALSKIKESSLVIYVFDISTTTPEALQIELAELPKSNINYLILANKLDLVPHIRLVDYATDKLVVGQNLMALSANSSENVQLLKQHMHHIVYQLDLNKDLSMVSNIRHFQALQSTANNLCAAIDSMELEISMDLVAVDIKQAIHNLGLITGEISTDDLLENIFRNFCIGK